MGEPAVVGLQRLPLVDREAQLHEFADLPLDALAFFRHRGRLRLRGVERIDRSAPASMGRDDVRDERARTGESVEQCALFRGTHQRLVFVLTVDVDEALADLAQLRRGARTSVHVGARTSTGIDHATEEAFAVVAREVEFGQQRRHCGEIRQIELRGHFGAFSARADDTRIGAPTEDEQQCIDQDRLAGAGLAGEHGKARREFEPEPIDDHEILDVQREEHG